MASWSAKLVLADELAQQLLAVGCKDLHFELLMAKAALEQELARNKRIFDASLTSSSAENLEEEIVEDDQSGLWLHPWDAKMVMTAVSLVVNPKFDQGRALTLMQAAMAAMQGRGIQVQVLVSKSPGHERELVRTASGPVIAVIGGNGTIRECINGILERPDRDSVSLALLGGGRSSCGLEATLGIHSLEDGLARLFKGVVRRMDVLKFHDHDADKSTYVVTAVYGAFVSWLKGTSWTPFLSRNSSGKLQNVLALSRTFEARLLVPESDALPEGQRLAQSNEYPGLVFTTVRHVSNSYMRNPYVLAPEAKLDDGHLHIAIIPNMALPEKAKVLAELTAGKSSDAIECLQVSSVTLCPTSSVTGRCRDLSRRPRSVGLDGDTFGGAPCTISVLPRALRILA